MKTDYYYSVLPHNGGFTGVVFFHDGVSCNDRLLHEIFCAETEAEAIKSCEDYCEHEGVTAYRETDVHEYE